MTATYAPYVEAFTLFAEGDKTPSIEFRVDEELGERISPAIIDRATILIYLGDVEAPRIASQRTEVRVDTDSRLADLDEAIAALQAVRHHLGHLEATHV